MTVLQAQFAAPFAEEEIQHFEGRGGKTMTYIEDETVMDRLDAVLGVGNWRIETEPVAIYDGVVKVTLSVRLPDNASEWVSYSDYGYPNRQGGESLKESVSDGIRRCGRYLGIGRDLYRRDQPSSQGTGRAGPSSPARPAAPPRSSTSVPDEPDWLEPTSIGTKVLPAQADNSDCPIHGVTWNGQFGDLWHKTEDGAYCRHPENVKRERAAARR